MNSSEDNRDDLKGWSGCLADQRPEFDLKGYRQESVGVWSRLPITGDKERIFYVPSAECSLAGEDFVKLMVDIIIQEDEAERDLKFSEYHQIYCTEIKNFNQTEKSQTATTTTTTLTTTINTGTTPTTVRTKSTTSPVSSTALTAITTRSTKKETTLSESVTQTETVRTSSRPELNIVNQNLNDSNETLVLILIASSATSTSLAVLFCCCLCCQSQSYDNFRRNFFRCLLTWSLRELYRGEKVNTIQIESKEIRKKELHMLHFIGRYLESKEPGKNNSADARNEIAANNSVNNKPISSGNFTPQSSGRNISTIDI